MGQKSVGVDNPEYRLEAARHRAAGTGLFLAYEKTGYDVTDGTFAYTQEEAKQAFKDATSATAIPFIYLSAEVTNEVFLETWNLQHKQINGKKRELLSIVVPFSF